MGHSYEAEKDLKKFYKKLDPTNTFNPGIGKTQKGHFLNKYCKMKLYKLISKYEIFYYIYTNWFFI